MVKIYTNGKPAPSNVDFRQASEINKMLYINYLENFKLWKISYPQITLFNNLFLFVYKTVHSLR